MDGVKTERSIFLSPKTKVFEIPFGDNRMIVGPFC